MLEMSRGDMQLNRSLRSYAEEMEGCELWIDILVWNSGGR